jgi:hypothetical protein
MHRIDNIFAIIIVVLFVTIYGCNPTSLQKPIEKGNTSENRFSSWQLINGMDPSFQMVFFQNTGQNSLSHHCNEEQYQKWLYETDYREPYLTIDHYAPSTIYYNPRGHELALILHADYSQRVDEMYDKAIGGKQYLATPRVSQIAWIIIVKGERLIGGTFHDYGAEGYNHPVIFPGRWGENVVIMIPRVDKSTLDKIMPTAGI